MSKNPNPNHDEIVRTAEELGPILAAAIYEEAARMVEQLGCDVANEYVEPDDVLSFALEAAIELRKRSKEVSNAE